MQISLKLSPDKPLVIPFNYLYQLQSAVYAMLGEVYESDFWHDGGFGDIAKYKGFCFSGLKGRYQADKMNKKIVFEDTIRFEVRSAVFEFIDAFQRAVEIHPYIKLFDTRLNVVGAFLGNQHLKDGITALRAVTPIVIHSTESDGHTVYYSPDNEEFFTRICLNAEAKFRAIYGYDCDPVLIRPAGEMKKVVTKYKNTWITGYQGPIEINTDYKTAEFIYNTGLGEKNSEGFGFVETDQ